MGKGDGVSVTTFTKVLYHGRVALMSTQSLFGYVVVVELYNH